MTPYSFNDKKQRMARCSFAVKTTRRRQDSRRRNPDGVKGNPPFRNPDFKSMWLQKQLRNLPESTEIYRNRPERLTRRKRFNRNNLIRKSRR